jgi:hypothetical protein
MKYEMFEKLIKNIKNIKNRVVHFKDVIIYYGAILLIIIRSTKDALYFDSNVRDYVRDIFKNLYIYSFIKINWLKFYDLRKVQFSIYYYFVKYVGIFIFILWIIFEAFFLRFYLIDTPLDAKMFINRKEKSVSKRRYIPLIGFEAVSFYVRPFYRVYNTAVIVYSNFKVLGWLIYIVYIVDLIAFLKFFLFLFLDLLFLVGGFIVLFFSFFNLIIRKSIPILRLFRNRFLLRFFSICDTFIYLVTLPFLLLNNLIRMMFHTIPKLFLLYTLLDFKEVNLIYQEAIKGNVSFLVNEEYEYSYWHNYFFSRIQYFEIIVRYLHRKLEKLPLWYYPFYKFYQYLDILYSFLIDSFLFSIIRFIYLFIFFFSFFFFLFILFFTSIYLPFFSFFV